MKFLIIFSILIQTNYCSKSSQFLVRTLLDSAQEIYTKNSLKYDLILVGEISAQINQISREFLTSRKNFVNEKILHIKFGKTNLEKSAIILTQSFDDALKFLSKSDLNNIYPKKLKFLFYIHNFKDKLPKVPIEWNFYHILHFSYFLINSKHEIHLVSLEWFTESACDQQQMKIFNTFDKKLKKWRRKLEIQEKFQNFHQCSIIFLVYFFGSVYHTWYKENIQDLQGLLVNLPEIVSKRGNSSAIIQYPIISRNGMKQSKNLTSHAIIGTKAIDLMAFPDYKIHVTSCYDDASYGFFTTPGEKYSSYEKLLLPFDDTTWKYLMITFGVAFITIFIVNCFPKFVQKAFYGTKSKENAFNVVRGFFGISQNVLPDENFPRILFLVFTIFCLIMRTAYQGIKIVFIDC
jgi:hypothetical protein